MRNAETALSLLLARGLPSGGEALTGSIDRVGRFDESTGEIVPLASSVIPAGSTVCIAGWAADLQAKRAAAGVCVRLGETTVEAEYGVRREDVAETHDNPGLLRTGFRAYVTLDPSLRGDVAVSAAVVDAEARSSSELPNGVTLTVIGGAPAVAIVTQRRAGSAFVNVDRWHLESGNEVPIDRPILVTRGSLLGLRGWLHDRAAQMPAAGVFALIDGRDVVRGCGWQSRPDVAAAMNRTNLLAVGFAVRVDTAALEPGWHEVQIGIVTSDGAAYDVDDTRFAFAVVPDHR